jgi:hypothetical protein
MMFFDTGTAPAVCYTMTLTADNVRDLQVQVDWTTLEQQALAQNIEVVVRGTLNGGVRGLLYRPSFDDYVTDSWPAPLTRAHLQNAIERGDTLTIMGVYPGSARPEGLPQLQELEVPRTGGMRTSTNGARRALRSTSGGRPRVDGH